MRERTEVLEAATSIAINFLIGSEGIRAIYTDAFNQALKQPIPLKDFHAIRKYPDYHMDLHIQHFTQIAMIEINKVLKAHGHSPLRAESPAVNVARQAFEMGYRDLLVTPISNPLVLVAHTDSFIEVKMDSSKPRTGKNTGDKLHVSIDDRDPANVEKAWGIIAQLAEMYGIDGYKILSRPSSDDEKGRQFTIYLHDKTPAESQQFINALEYYFRQEQIRPDPRGMPVDCPPIVGSSFTSYRNDHFEFDPDNEHYIPEAPPGYLARDVIDCAKMVLAGTDISDDQALLEHFSINADAIEQFRQQVDEVVAHVAKLEQQGHPVAWHDVMRQSQLGQMSIGLSADIVSDYKHQVELQMQNLLASRRGMNPQVFQHYQGLYQQRLERATLDLNRFSQHDMKRRLQGLTDGELQRSIAARRGQVYPVGKGNLSPNQQLEERVELAKEVNEQANRSRHF